MLNISNIFWSYFERWASKLITLIVFVLLARLLEPLSFGLVALAKVCIDYLDWVASQGLDLAVIQKKEVDKNTLSTAFWMVVGISVLLSVLLFLSAGLMSELLNEPKLRGILFAMAGLLILNSLSRIPTAILIREGRFRALAGRSIAVTVFGGVVGVSLAHGGWGAWSLIWQQYAVLSLGLVLLWRAARWQPALVFNRAAAASLYKFSWKVMLDQQVTFFANRLDELLIGSILGPTTLGIYSVAKRMFEAVVEAMFIPLRGVLTSAFSRGQDKRDEIASSLEWFNVRVACISFIVLMIIAAGSDSVVDIVFGARWASAGIPMSILMISGIFVMNQYLVHPALNSIGAPHLVLMLNVFRAFISALALTLLSAYGIVGVAIAMLVKNVLGAIGDLVVLSKVLNAPIMQMVIKQSMVLFVSTVSVISSVWIAQSYIQQVGREVGLLLVSGFATVVYFFGLFLLFRGFRGWVFDRLAAMRKW